jgi:membrane fusion protein (multidrug efflux system)
MLKKLLLATLGVGILVGAIIYAKLDQFAAMGDAAKSGVEPPTTVTAMRVDKSQWEQSIPAAATVTAVQGVMVSAEVGGRVTRIGFESGAAVSAEDILVQLDTASEEAQLASAEAAAALAEADLKRVRALGKRDLASRDAVDSAEAQVKQTVAQVGNMHALIAKKTIRAPFSGRLGLRLVNLGQVLSAGDAIVSLHMLDPIYVDFSIPQQRIRSLKKGMEVRVTTDAAPGETFSSELIAVNPEVDTATRSVRVRSRIANPGETLHAGMFVKVEVILPDKQSVLPVVATAVLYAPFGDSVFVVDRQKGSKTGEPDLVLRQQFVRVGQTQGDFVDVVDGLKPGETVVTSGVFKLRTGMKVVIDNKLAPKAELSPHPSDS